MDVKKSDPLKNPMDLPPEFKGWLVKWLEVNPPQLPIKQMLGYNLLGSGEFAAYKLVTAPITAVTATTYATGRKLLSVDLGFEADGASDYLVCVKAVGWTNNTVGGQNILYVDLDGAQAGELTVGTINSASNFVPLNVEGTIQKPTKGTHTLNVVFYVSAGSGTISANNGAGANSMPLLVGVKRI